MAKKKVLFKIFAMGTILAGGVFSLNSCIFKSNDTKNKDNNFENNSNNDQSNQHDLSTEDNNSRDLTVPESNNKSENDSIPQPESKPNIIPAPEIKPEPAPESTPESTPEIKPEPAPEPKENDHKANHNQTHFVRPPFIAKFKIKNTDFSIATIFNHLDSPGSRKKGEYIEPKPSILLADRSNKQSDLNKQGAQEVSEFLGLIDVINENKDLANFVIYGGDTNIKNENFYLARKYPENIQFTLDRNLKLKKYDQKFLTSLGTRGGYSEQYDKMFFINQLPNTFKPKIITNGLLPYKVDIYRTFNDVISKAELEKLKGWKSKKNDRSTIRSQISDHTPVFTDVVFSNPIETLKVNETLRKNQTLSKEQNTIRIAHWNILNFGGPNQDAKTMAIAATIYKSGFDITGLTEINDGRGNYVQNIVNLLNEYAGKDRYKFVLQNKKDTNIRPEYLQSNKFGKAQQEQVAVIYDSQNFEFVSSQSYLKPIKYYKDN
ncbi:hypothetical protein C1937_00160 [Metamycoplasma hominis]|uniref:hypothetical protein n=1 Tax=Metamycoplasma hominis TaxID=2098 RepID=UPI000CD6ADB4|nr:hypothetical protein [Metamycoplasma hominis]AUW36884.1 hypothetical protein C1937_00160 [Metamycoplasma hominis]